MPRTILQHLTEILISVTGELPYMMQQKTSSLPNVIMIYNFYNERDYFVSLSAAF